MHTRRLSPSVALLAALSFFTTLPAEDGKLAVDIHNLPGKVLLTNDETSTPIEGTASVFGGLKQLDLFFILDASKSLYRTDPDDFRVQGAKALVRAIPQKYDIQIGVVAFDSKATTIAPLSGDREEILAALDNVPRDGGTNLHAGIREAMAGFDSSARKDAARIALLFTDGKSDHDEALLAAAEAKQRGMVVHSVLLLDRDKSAELLQSIASTTDGAFVYVDDPTKLPEAFLALKTTGVDRVQLDVDGGAPIATEFIAGHFDGTVPLKPGKNTVTATAFDLDGGRVSKSVEVTVTGPLRVTIASPLDGTLLTHLQQETEVRVDASVFSNPTAEIRREWPTLGVDKVMLHAGDGPPIPTAYVDGMFVGKVPLRLLANRIRATATSFDGRSAESAIDLSVRPPGCSDLRVDAMRDGAPAISLNDRGLEVIFDASNSMWAQIEGVPRIDIAKQTVQQVMTGFPADFFTALRVYGHQHPRERHNCEDSELLIPLGAGNAEQIRQAIEKFKPRGQTPLGYSVAQVPADFGDFVGEKAVVLITDGIESCGGDAVAAAKAFQEEGRHRPVHVIGFGFGRDAEAEAAMQSLRQIAASTGGEFIAAGDADELRRALEATAGTPYTLWREGRQVGRGTLGADDLFHLEDGAYQLRLAGEPPREFDFTLGAEEALQLTLLRVRDQVASVERRSAIGYKMCEPSVSAAP